MRVLGSLTDVFNLVFKRNGHDVTVKPNGSTTFTAARTFSLPNADADHTLAAIGLAQIYTAAQTFSAGATISSGQTLTLTGATVAGQPTWSSTQSLNTSGNAATATALATSRNLWGVAFDGTANVTAAPTFTNGFTGQSTVTLPATVNYTSNGSIVKSGDHALTLTTSNTTNVTFPAGTVTASVLGTAQTYSALKTFSAGIAISGGTTNNYLQIETGGTKGTGKVIYTTTTGFDINNSGLIISDAGVVTVGPSASTAANLLVNGKASLTHDLEVKGIGDGSHSASKGRLSFGSGNTYLISYGADAATGGALQFVTRSSDGTSVNLAALTIAATTGVATFAAVDEHTLGLQVNGGTAGAKKIVYASSAININNSSLQALDDGTLIMGAAPTSGFYNAAGSRTFGTMPASIRFAYGAGTAGVIQLFSGAYLSPTTNVKAAKANTACSVLNLNSVTADGSTAFEVGKYWNNNYTFSENANIDNYVSLFSITATGAVTLGPTDNTAVHDFRSPKQTTVGAAGGASALPDTPTGYVEIKIQGTAYVIPYYAKS